MSQRICSIPDCERPRRKREWCEMHYGRWRKNGSPFDADQSWVIGERGECVVCGRPVPEGIGFRRYCGRSCAVLSRKGDRPTERACAICGDMFSLIERSEQSGRMRYTSASTCGRHSRPGNLSRYFTTLAERDGPECGICGTPVDPELTYPDRMSPSVDHVIPRSHGGADALHNYRLTHLICNVRRQDKRE